MNDKKISTPINQDTIMKGIYCSFGKRLFDITGSGIMLLLFSFPMAVIALLIKMTSFGPVFYRQDRVGREGRLFRIFKFRTMLDSQENKSTITVAGDIRITSIGRILRKYKLDEIPQLINVFLGEMSLVGPRPDVSPYMDKLQKKDRNILNLRPGITGPSTLEYADEEKILKIVADPIHYNDEIIFPHKVHINLNYWNNYSFNMDLRYLLKTASFLLSRLKGG